MKASAIFGPGLVSMLVLAGCDITGLDNDDAPSSILSGQVVFEGEPVGVRSNGVELELWEPGWDFDLKIPVHLDQDGTFKAMVFDGSYEMNLLSDNGPWVNDLTRIPIEVRGEASIEVPVTPYYVIRDEQLVYNAEGGGPTGAIRATFNVRQIVTSQALEYVGLYINGTTFVDRNTSLSIPNDERERTGEQILPQLNANEPITISVQLPENIYETGSPERREYVFVRIGVKTVGVSEMLFTPVHKVPI